MSTRVVVQQPTQHISVRGGAPTVVQAPSNPPRIIQSGVPGPVGPEGPPGDVGGSLPWGQITDKPAFAYTHTQSTPATLWTITHPLGRRARVQIIDSAGTAVYGTVQYPPGAEHTTVTVSFLAPFSGTAELT